MKQPVHLHWLMMVLVWYDEPNYGIVYTKRGATMVYDVMLLSNLANYAALVVLSVHNNNL